MTKKKNLTKHITLIIQELERMSMECVPLGVFSEGLHLDLWIQVSTFYISHRCESGHGKVTHVDELKHCCDGTHSIILLRIFFFFSQDAIGSQHNLILT